MTAVLAVAGGDSGLSVPTVAFERRRWRLTTVADRHEKTTCSNEDFHLDNANDATLVGRYTSARLSNYTSHRPRIRMTVYGSTRPFVVINPRRLVDDSSSSSSSSSSVHCNVITVEIISFRYRSGEK